MVRNTLTILTGDILEQDVELSLLELCRCCQARTEQILAMVEEGILEPTGRDPNAWRFAGSTVRRARIALTLQRDLGVNLAGAALAVELMEEMEALRARLRAWDIE